MGRQNTVLCDAALQEGSGGITYLFNKFLSDAEAGPGTHNLRSTAALWLGFSGT